MKTVKAAAVQLSPVLYSREATVDKIVRKITELGQQGVRFATFPETVVPYYPYFSAVQPPFKNSAEHHRLFEQSVAKGAPLQELLVGDPPEKEGFWTIAVNHDVHGRPVNVAVASVKIA